MGSSKKKKDKDRDNNGERRKHKKDKKDSERSRDRKRRREGEEDELLSYALSQEGEERESTSGKEAKSSNEESSLSIEETNKIRVKLGLKPLAVESVTAGNETNNETKNSDENFVHAPPVNILEKQKQEKYREKLQEIREKREMYKKLQNVKKLGESSDDDDSAMSWVKKSRVKDQEKMLAEKRAKLLEEMDEEFGVGELVDNVMRERPKSYTAKDLQGLTVEHSTEMFKEGKGIVLTLKDSGVLDDEDDVLVNINMIDTEKAEKNVELKKKKPDYVAYEEFDESGKPKLQGILSKYDEEIEGEKRKMFNLSNDGAVNLTKEQELQKIRERLHNQAVSLTMPEPQLANEYYTQDEMSKFKKRKEKKKRKIKKRETLKADDLIPLERGTSDHGSRGSIMASKKDSNNTDNLKDDLMEWQMADPDDLAVDIPGPEINDNEPLTFDEEDEAQLELQLALERSRRSKVKKENIGPEKLANNLASLSNHSTNASGGQGAIVLDSTSEFCRTLGEIPTYGASGNRADVEEDNDDEEEEMDLVNPEDDPGGWEVVKQEVKDEHLSSDEAAKKETSVLDDEPVLGMGIGAALQMAHKKGMIEDDKAKDRKFAGGLALPETVKIIDEEKMRDEERDRLRDRGRDRDRDRDRHNPNAFREKTDYKPDVKLEYVDRHGRHMNPKEAFRDLSHKFHGKIPGKLKMEKREKKFSEDLVLKKMNAGDTPLNTVALFSEKQKQGQTPYLILSGAGQTFSSGTTIRKSK